MTDTTKPRQDCWQCSGKGESYTVAGITASVPCSACWPVVDGETVTPAEFLRRAFGEGQK